MTTRETLKNIPRPVELVTLPGGAAVHVRSLTLGELRRIDQLVAELTSDPDEQRIRTLELMCAAALAEADGTPAFPGLLDPVANAAVVFPAITDVQSLCPSQMEAIVQAIASKDRAKNC